MDGWKKGDPLILKRNPNYWKGKPDIDEVRIEYIPDDNTRVLKLQGGETDVIDFVPFSQIDTLNASPGTKAQTFDIQQTAFIMLNNKQKPLDDVKVRQALAYAPRRTPSSRTSTSVRPSPRTRRSRLARTGTPTLRVTRMTWRRPSSS